MAADGGSERELINRIWIACAQNLVRGFGAVNIGVEGVAPHGPAIALIRAAMQGMNAIGLGGAEADAVGTPARGSG